MTAIQKLRADEAALRQTAHVDRWQVGRQRFGRAARGRGPGAPAPDRRGPARSGRGCRACRESRGRCLSRLVAHGPSRARATSARIADALEARVEELARTIALETGNALRTQARPEAKTTADIIRYFGGLGGELKGETIPFGEHVLSYTRREPLGVVGAIIPWNAPVLLAASRSARRSAPATRWC